MDTYEAERKQIYLRLPYKGELLSVTIRRNLDKAFKRTFFAAQINCFFNSQPLFQQKLKDRLPRQANSMCIYQFTCSCGASYIGRTTRSLSTRIAEHIPSWLAKGERKIIRSSILAHLVDTGHRVDSNQAFTVIYRVSRNLLRSVRQKLLNTAEAVAIHLERPDLCIHKSFVQALHLPWPTNHQQDQLGEHTPASHPTNPADQAAAHQTD